MLDNLHDDHMCMHFCPAVERNSLNIYRRGKNRRETVKKIRHAFYVQFSYDFRDNEIKGN